MAQEIKTNPIAYRSLKACVKNYLKQQMEQGQLVPGDRIEEKELCDTLNISRTPIREALIELESEGFIEIIPRKSIRVRKLSDKEIRDMFEVIGTLEAMAAERAVDLLTETDLSEMEDIYHKMLATYKRGDFDQYVDWNTKLHDFHIKLYDNKILSNIVGQLKERLWNFPRTPFHIPEWEEMMLKDHAELVDLFQKRDKEAIKKLLMEVHWNFDRNYPFLVQYFAFTGQKT